LREHRAGCRLPIPSCRQSVTQRCLLKNPSKSTLAHDAVAAAVLHKHHPIIPIGAGLIQFVYDLRSRLANRGYPSEKSISAIFRASFYINQGY
jgi:hypothetical protein